jgi:hypothetical protein
MALLKLRRHVYFLDVSSITVEEVSAGRASGGGPREWFVHHPEMFGDKWIPHTSMIAAIRMGACY